ncbi:hypothetical protein M758_2G187000 [Ceratodon purpureus]|nr:hypothetical protein M758_2G186800 [Ceratodon purpureus]KAG0627260.1 hypothetical protein M758_2G187000 [Ceratodon purpureus]
MALPICANIDLTKILLLKYSKTKVQWNCPVYAVKMLEEATHADITFEVAAGGSVKAHRDVLANISPVFVAMFRHDMKEKLTTTVKISDMTIDGLKLFLILLYTTKDVNDAGIEALNDAVDKYFPEFHNAMKKYQVESTLGSLYICALERNLNRDNGWIYYQSFTKGSIGSVTCYKYILEHYDEVIMSNNFLETMKQDPGWVCHVVRDASSEASCACVLKNFMAALKRRRTEATIFI